jgi:hypothetical protein
MTFRCRMLALPALAGLFLGMLREQPLLSLLSLSVLLWLLSEACYFCWRLWIELPRLTVQRTINGRTDSAGVLWAGRTVIVTVRMTMRSLSMSPFVLLKDVLPENLELIPIPVGLPPHLANQPSEILSPASVSGSELLLKSRVRDVQWSYAVRVRAPGEVTWPGVRIQLEDSQRFFRVRRFIKLSQTFRVLPGYAAPVDPKPQLKRLNAIPQHGIHRLQRSGMGSELLDLREYVPGDPPKSIAWKASARRDLLMTRQYESDVPVRLQLFVDGSYSTRVGGFGCRLLDQMTYVAASVARSSISAGDPVGLVLLDEQRYERLPSLTGERGFYRLLNSLADFSTVAMPTPQRLTAAMMSAAISICGERFPELLDDQINLVPFTLFPLWPRHRRSFHERCRLAAVLARINRLSVMDQVRLIHDDAWMGIMVQRFLTQSGVAWMDPVIRNPTAGFSDAGPRLESLGNALIQSVGHARDHEVFVVMADLLECAPAISYLLPAVKTVLARHHRLAFVCPSLTFQRPAAASPTIKSDSVDDLMLVAEQSRVRDLSDRLRRELGRLGARVSFAGEPEAIRLIHSEIDLARTGRVSSRSAVR